MMQGLYASIEGDISCTTTEQAKEISNVPNE